MYWADVAFFFTTEICVPPSAYNTGKMATGTDVEMKQYFIIVTVQNSA
jgi:hypothetical protein